MPDGVIERADEVNGVGQQLAFRTEMFRLEDVTINDMILQLLITISSSSTS
jgi:hypothetical protein